MLPVPLYGVHGNIELHRAWWRTVTESTAPNLINADNVSLAAMYAKWLGPGRPRRSRQRQRAAARRRAAPVFAVRVASPLRKGSRRRCC